MNFRVRLQEGSVSGDNASQRESVSGYRDHRPHFLREVEASAEPLTREYVVKRRLERKVVNELVAVPLDVGIRLRARSQSITPHSRRNICQTDSTSVAST